MKCSSFFALLWLAPTTTQQRKKTHSSINQRNYFFGSIHQVLGGGCYVNYKHRKAKCISFDFIYNTGSSILLLCQDRHLTIIISK